MKKIHFTTWAGLFLLFFPVWLRSQSASFPQWNHSYPAEHLKKIILSERPDPAASSEELHYRNGSMFLLDSQYVSDWFNVPDEQRWIPSLKRLYAYDAHGLRTEERNYSGYSDSLWSANKRFTYFYDNNQNLSETQEGTWYQGNWYDYIKTTIAYDDNGNLIASETYWKDSLTGNWDTWYRGAFTYDTDGHLTEVNAEFWDASLNAFIPYYTQMSQYDPAGNAIVQDSYEWDAALQNWEGEDKYEWQYNAQHLVIQEIHYYWNTETDTWAADTKNDFSYDNAGNQTERTVSWMSLVSTEWNLQFRYLYDYNLAGQQTATVILHRDFADESWLYAQWRTFSYDENGNLEQNLFYQWDNVDGGWEYFFKIDYYWSEHDIITAATESNEAPFHIYPNPATDFLYVAGMKANTTAYIYSADGALKQRIFLNGNPCLLTVRDLPPGTYFVRLEAEGKTAVQRFIKQ